MNWFYNSSNWINISIAFTFIFVGYLLAKRGSQFIEHSLSHRFSRHLALLISRSFFYLILLTFTITGLQHLGFNLSVLLGAAGVFTVAISFASQTAASNLISGIFLLFEHPFKVGDSIEVNAITGVVESIDLLSTKLRTSDNKLVRIPNEILIKSNIVNLNFYETRRVDLIVAITYNSDIEEVKSLLLTLAKQCKYVLHEPVPSIVLNAFAEAAIELKFMVWVNTADVSVAKNELQEEIKQQFDKKGLSMPYSSLTFYRSTPRMTEE